MRALFLLSLGLLSVVPAARAQETTNIWQGTTSPDWFTPQNWSLASVPVAGEAVLITNPAGNQALLTNATPLLGSLVISNSSLVCSNWFTFIQATNITLLNKGRITLPYPFAFTNQASGLFSNRVHVICTSLLVEAGGEINADARGYLVSQGPGAAPSAGGSNVNGGGGHGGRGGDESSGRGGYEYDSTNAPLAPGSGGARWSSSAFPTTNGCGGGVVRIEAGTAILNGAVLARGSTGLQYDGGGAGGSVYLTCGAFGGTGGVIRADGGEGGYSYGGGGGGGGRIALEYTALIDAPSVRFSAAPGRLYTAEMAGMGSLHLPDLALVTPDTLGRLFENIRLIVPGWNQWTVDSLTLAGNTVCIGENGFTLTVTRTLAILSNAWLTVGSKALSARTSVGVGGRLSTNPVVEVGGPLLLQDGAAFNVGGFGQESLSRLTIGGALILSNAPASQTALLNVASGWTNPAAGLSNGGLIEVQGPAWIGSNGWLTAFSHPTNGGSLRMLMKAVNLRPGGGINANNAGFRSFSTQAYGPGAGLSAGSRGGGGSYGGKGGRGDNAASLGGAPYGETNRPLDPGSAGGFGHSPQPGSAHGGGLIRLEATALTLDGTLSANGGNCISSYGGGGSGGGILLFCDSFTGSVNSLIAARGGNGGASGGGGGGGRVAVAVGMTETERAQLVAGEPVPDLNVFTNWHAYAGNLNVNGGTGWSNGAPGSLVFLQVTAGKTILITGEPGNYGQPFPDPYGYTVNVTPDSWFTNGVSSPADESNGVRRACLGWRLSLSSGEPVSEEETFQTVFPVSDNYNLVWRWTNEYALSVSADPGGTVSTASNGWLRHGARVGGLSATPSPGFLFQCWTGDVPAASRLDNPLALVMDQPRTFAALFYPAAGGTGRVWTGSGNWHESPTNWSPAGLPSPLDDVEIRSGQCLVDGSAAVGSIQVSNTATLVLSNWNTVLSAAGAVTVRSNALVTHAGPFTFPSQMSNRIHLVCGSLTVDRFGRLDASQKGYNSASGPGRGYGGGSNDGTGAGHGGRGGSNTSFTAVQAGGAYGSSNAPTAPGSGGGGGYINNGYQGRGGGAILIQAEGAVTVDGTILADAQNGGVYWAGGSGGSILILCDSFSGSTSGVIRAAGGARGSGYVQLGGGGGGRISIGRRFGAAHREALLNGMALKLSTETNAPAFAGAIDAPGGAGGQNGQDGTVVFMRTAPGGTLLMLR